MAKPLIPTDEQLMQLHRELWEDGVHSVTAYGRAVLERWGRPTIEPVPIPEPGVADHITDDQGRRWDRTMDAALWAKAFCLICPEMASREDVMISWFANAIMAGCDHQAWKIDAERKPVPVSERLPEPEDCDAEGFCWWFSAADPTVGTFGVAACWVLRKHEPEDDDWRTHWLPAHALPLPRQPAPDASAS